MVSTLIGQRRTNLGPLTTTFTAPTTCTSMIQHCSTCSGAWRSQVCQDGSGDADVHDDADCWPPRSGDATISNPTYLGGWGFYSPGTLCPSGYYSACSATGGGNSDWLVEYQVLTSETAVGCCPTGYACTNGNEQTCVQKVSTATTFDVASCNGSSTGPLTTYTMPATLTINSSVKVISTYYLYAPLIQINFQASDLTATSSSTTPSTSGSTARSTETTTEATTEAATPATTSIAITSLPASSTPNSGLSTGAKVGMGVGIPVFIIALSIGAFLLFRRIKRRKLEAVELSGEVNHDIKYTPEGGNSAGGYHNSEMLATEQSSELDSARPPVELGS